MAMCTYTADVAKVIIPNYHISIHTIYHIWKYGITSGLIVVTSVGYI